MQRYRVGILGATGLVGQRLIEGLAGHPWFEVSGLAASERSAGKRYGDVCGWVLGSPMPEAVAGTIVTRCEPGALDECDLVFSALDRPVAAEVEPAFARAGFAVVSNASAFRQAPDVPLVVPEVNADHLAMVAHQGHGGGFIVTNPNCSATGLVLALAPLHRAFGIRRLFVSTMQAVSGAGTAGPSALQMVDNVIPFIPGEEEKLEEELSKLLGDRDGGTVRKTEIPVSAHCHRVPTIDGHLEAVSVELDGDPSPDEAIECLRGWRGQIEADRLPSAPAQPVEVRSEPDRPQPRLDRDAGKGMSAVVGRVRRCPLLGLKFVVLSHNAVRGAAGGTLLNAELLAARGLLPRRNGA